MKIVLFTGRNCLSTVMVLRRLFEVQEISDIMVVLEERQKNLGKLLKSQIKNIKKHGILWIPVSTYEAIAEVLLSVSIKIRSTFKASKYDNGYCDSLEKLQIIHSFLLYKTKDIHSEDSIHTIKKFKPVLGIVCGTGILKPSVFGIPLKGSINIHKGKVPYYRGQPPAFWELWNGESEVGVTIHWVVEKLDAGDIVMQDTIPIRRYDTLNSLHGKLDRLGAQLVAISARKILLGANSRIKQDTSLGRVYYQPTLKQQRILKKRMRGKLPYNFGLRDYVKFILKFIYLYCGYCQVRNYVLKQQKKSLITVLLYHRVNDDLNGINTVCTDTFQRQMEYLRKNYEVINIKGSSPN